ncbi:hypothetical protein [Haloarcula sebkhae]|uniref:Uncharacterized protein n=2 Tax=Haloarcula sebkhae TaxID=932660 RepID=A0ACC6VJK9_9EURY|nr:hypothetical protein [Haloarcula sebkhae]GGK74526.1 hypothetical protein GCM10009067_28400 [Haloarcula sebkhae]
MLQTQTYTLGEEIASLDDRLTALKDRINDLEPGTGEYDAAQSQKSRLQYYKIGLVWQRDEAGWGSDAELTLGALSALEEAEMDRHIPSNAGQKERRLWFAAASTVSAPNVDDDDDIEAAFAALTVHPGYASWVEAEANDLGVPSESGNRSSTSSTATGTSATSTDGPGETTTSSSDSRTG